MNLPLDISKMKKVLIVDFNRLGDMLLDSGVYYDLKRNFPHLEIHAFIWEESKEAFTGILVDKVYTTGRGFFKEALIANNIPHHYDLAISLHTSLRVSAVMVALDADIRAGFAYKRRSLHNAPVPLPRRTLVTGNRGLELSYLMNRLTGKFFTCFPKFEVSPHSKRRKGINIGIHLSARESRRNWKEDSWVDVISVLAANYDACVHFFGLFKDIEQVQGVISKLNIHTDIYNWCNRLSFQELAGEIDKLDLFICVNSAPMHLGMILQTKTVALIDDKSRSVVIPVKYLPYFKGLSLEKTTVNEVLTNCANFLEG